MTFLTTPSESRCLAPEQRLLCVLRGHGHDMIGELRRAMAATHEADVAEVAAAILLERVDLRFIVRRDRPVPVQPELPAIRHGVGHVDLNDAGPFPMPAPPCRRVQAPEILGPPLAKMIGNGPFDL